MALPETKKEFLSVPLEDSEKIALADDMAKLEIEIGQIEARKKSASESFNAEIKEREAELHQKALEYTEGSKQVEVECRIEYNTPEKGMKRITRLDTGAEVKVYEMSEAEKKAIEEPGLFDGSEQADLRVIYGFPFDAFSEEFVESNTFIVNSVLALTENEIDISNFDDGTIQEIIDCLAVKLNHAEIHSLKSGGDLLDYIFKAELDEVDGEDPEAWYFFPKIPQPDASLPVLETRTITFDSETMDEAEMLESYSADLFPQGLIRNRFDFEGEKYVTTSSASSGFQTESLTAYELQPIDGYEGEKFAYRDLPSNRGYEGLIVAYRKKEFVLTNPIQIVFPQEENSDYIIPENEDVKA